MQRPFPAYSGDDPYIFVSYAHDDADTIYPELVRLKEAGFNIWYDEGIAPGASWRDELAESINDCALFVIFITPRSASSENCQREVNFAENHGRKILAVHLQETDLSMGMELALSNRQAILKHQFREADYRDKLITTLSQLLGQPVDLSHVPVPAVARSGRVPLYLTMAAFVVLAAAAAWLIPRGSPSPQEETTEQPTSEVTQPDPEIPAAAIPTLAVLPFENLSPSEENAYFASGVHQDVLFNLSKIPDLQVIARNSVLGFADSTSRSSEIAELLSATHLLTGSVRRAGEQVRITVTLIDGNSEQQLWAEMYDRELKDVFAIQSEVATSIADALQVTMSVGVAEEIATAPTGNLDAYDLFIQARELAESGSADGEVRALRLFERVIAMEPDFAAAHAGVARLLTPRNTFVAFPDDQKTRALSSAERALALNDNLVDSHIAMGQWLVANRRNEQAYTHYKAALAIDPGHSEVRRLYGIALRENGDLANALIQWQQSLDLDPLSPATHLQIANVLDAQGETEKAIGHAEQALALDPTNINTLNAVGFYHFQAGMYHEAVGYFHKVLVVEPYNASSLTWLFNVLASLGYHDALSAWAVKLKGHDDEQHYRALSLAYQGTGETDKEDTVTREWQEKFPSSFGAGQSRAYHMSRQASDAQREERHADSIRLRGEAQSILRSLISADKRDGGYRWRLDNQFAIAAEMVTAKSLGDHETADRIAEQLLEVYESQPFNWLAFWAGMAHAIRGDEDTAIELFRELAETHSMIWTDLFRLYGLTDDVYNMFGGLENNIALLDVIHRIEAGNDVLRQRISADYPDLLDASVVDR